MRFVRCGGWILLSTKKKSANPKVMALFLFYLIFITLNAASRSAFRSEVPGAFLSE
jgi:hypothetical protein